MKELYQALNTAVRHGQNVVLATVVSSKGSLPMSKRAKMLVFQDGSIMGTVGGGILEANVIEEAQGILKNITPKLMHFDLTSEQIETDGLTCGGTVEIFLEPFAPEMDMTVILAIEGIYSDSEPAVTITLLPTDAFQNNEERNPSANMSRKILINNKRTLIGTTRHTSLDERLGELARSRLGQSHLSTGELELSPEEAQSVGVQPGSRSRFFLESILPAPTAYLFGGGHVSLYLSKILHFIGFEYVVVDDRQEFLTDERFPEAKDFVLHSFEKVFDVLDVTPHSSYVIIVTRGHKSDLQVLRQALIGDVKYIGMIGSKRKVTLLFEQLQQEGFAPELLERVHAPIGLEIEADTPEEIAISIAAELINVRRNNE